jgi:hypothetical protein
MQDYKYSAHYGVSRVPDDIEVHDQLAPTFIVQAAEGASEDKAA